MHHHDKKSLLLADENLNITKEILEKIKSGEAEEFRMNPVIGPINENQIRADTASLEASTPDGRVDSAEIWQSANFKQSENPNLDRNLSRQFVSDWGVYMDPYLPPGYGVTSGYRQGDTTAGKGRTIDLTGRDQEVITWFKENVPGLERTNGREVKHYKIPGTPFAVAWHQNWNITYDDNGNVISKTPAKTGWHFDIKYADDVKVYN